jgi:hypothetical protein
MDSLERLLETGVVVAIYKNALGSYTAMTTWPDEMEEVIEDAESLTDGFTVEQALESLAPDVAAA